MGIVRDLDCKHLFPNRCAAVGLVVSALATIALGAGGCGTASTSGEAEVAAGAPVEIGYLASLSGLCARYAPQYVQGAELAVRRIDARGGVDGHELRLIVRDDRATPSVADERARALIEQEHVKFLAGTCLSKVAVSVARLVANPTHTIYVVGASDPAVVAGGREVYAFDTLPTATAEGRVAAEYIRAHARWKRVAVIAEGYTYGYQATGAFARALAANLGQTIVSRQYVPVGGEGFAPYIRKLIAARPDAVYAAVIDEDAQTFVADAEAAGLYARTHVLQVADYATLAGMDRAPVGAEGYTIYPTAAIYRTADARAVQSLGVSTANDGAAGEGFNQIEVIAQGIAKAGSTDPTKVREALAGAWVQVVQGNVRVGRCEHELATPVAVGRVAGPTAEQPFAHLEPLRLADVGEDTGC